MSNYVGEAAFNLRVHDNWCLGNDWVHSAMMPELTNLEMHATLMYTITKQLLLILNQDTPKHHLTKSKHLKRYCGGKTYYYLVNSESDFI